MGGFGAGSFGSMPFGTGGGGSPPPPVLLEAVQRSLNEVCLTFSGFAGSTNPCMPSTPTNVESWVLENLSAPGGGTPPYVQWVEWDGSDRFCLYLDAPLCCDALYRLTFIPDGGTAEFMSVCVAEGAKAVPLTDRGDGFIVDLSNPQVPGDVVQPRGAALGTFEVTDDGDLAQVRGPASLRKRIIRRAMTIAAQFFHLPNYGSDLKVKVLTRPDLMARYQEKLRSQVLREPEVAVCRVTIRQDLNRPNVTVAAISVVTSAGEAIDVTVPISLP